MIITEGSTTMILCEAIGYPPPTILWNRVDGILSDRVSVSDSVSVPTGYGNVTRVSVNLTITNASRKDTGVYTCSANNSVGSDSSNVSITVQCELCEMCCLYKCVIKWNFSVAPEIILPLNDFLENETNSIQFVCQAIGVPVPYIRWNFNGAMVNLSDSSKYNSSSMYLNESVIESTLSISNTQSSDVGRYTCVASNIIGTDKSSGVLTVNGKYTYMYMQVRYTFINNYYVHVCYRCCWNH